MVLYNYMSRLVKMGHTVTWFASGFPDGEEEFQLDGIRIIRRYSINSVYFLAWKWFRDFSRREKVDCIIDQAGGIPLLSPLYVKKIPITFFIHHIGDKEWDAQFPFPFGALARHVFVRILQLYRKHETITVSHSTKQELLALGFRSNKTHVIDNALDFSPVERADFDSKDDSIVFVGRLTPIKRVEDAIRAFSYFAQKHEEYVLRILGSEQNIEYYRMLRRLVSTLGLTGRVEFLGTMSPENRNAILKKSKICLVPSEKEGFGLVVLEANAFAVPVIAYDVPGLRDTVQNGKNGYLIPSGDYVSMGEKLCAIISDQKLYKELAHSALCHVQSLPNWDAQTEKLQKILFLNANKE